MFLKIYQQYFINGNFSSQVKGRALSNFPNFLKLLNEPLLFIGFVTMLCSVLLKKMSKLRELAFLAFSQILFLLLIYYLTERGGPAIKNYFLESITISLIFFAVLFCHFIKKVFFIFNYNNYILIVIFNIFFSISIFFTNFVFLNEISLFFKNYHVNKTLVNVLIYIILLILLILFIFKFKKQFYILSLVVFIIIFFRSSHYSIKKFKHSSDYWETYYEISRLIKLNFEVDKRNIIFNAILNGTDVLDAENRVRNIAIVILELSQNEYNSYLCTGFKCDHSLQNISIITDDLHYINSPKVKNFKKIVLIDKEHNTSLSKSLYLLKN
jgi:hypothetical protein